MAFASEEYEEIGRYIKENLVYWLTDMSLARPPVVYEIELRDRIIRVEEELRHQRDLIQQILHQMDKRFEQVERRIEAQRQEMILRFEQVDKHIEAQRQEMILRFAQVDKRFEEINRRIDLFMKWSFGTSLTLAGVVIAAIKFF